MGRILGQWGARLGARMIGTVGSPAQAAVALEHGYDAVIDYTAEDFAARTLELTGGRGVDVIYDGIGKAAVLRYLARIRPRVMVVSYGTADRKRVVWGKSVSGRGELGGRRKVKKKKINQKNEHN